MPSAADPIELRPIKMCLTGDSGVGKTVALAPLVCAGYNVRSVDADNGIDILINVLNASASPFAQYIRDKSIDLSRALIFETVNDKMITMEVRENNRDRVRIQPNAATVWPRIERLLHDWRGSDGLKLGSPSSWDDNTILVIDSGTFAGFAALYYAQAINGHLGVQDIGNQWRRDVGMAQTAIETMLQLICSSALRCHVIFITHINYLNESFQDDRESNARVRQVSSSASDIFGVSRAYPSAVGRALGPRIGRYFNNVLELRVEGTGPSSRRVIHTVPQGAINVKNSAPFSLKPRYDVTTGLAEIFAVLRNQAEPTDLIARLQPRRSAPALAAKLPPPAPALAAAAQ